MAALSTEQISLGLSTGQVVALSTGSMAALSTAQISLGLTATQIAAMETRDIAALSTAQVQQGLTTAQVVALTTAQVQALTTAQIRLGLSPAQVAAMETRDIAALTTAQISQGLSTAQVLVLATSQVAALMSTQLAAMTSAQVCAMTSTQLAALSSSQIALFGTKTPIVLDLDGDGIRTLSIAAGVQFDLGADGKPVQTGWVSRTDGLLVMDRNRDGTINDGSELFGSSTTLADGSKAADGYVALSELDSNNDGKVSAADAGFADLQVWVDANSDGVSAYAELKSLGTLGISSISVVTERVIQQDNGNIVGLISSYQTTDGTSHAAADVWFITRAGASPATPEALGAGLPDLVSRVGNLVEAMGVYQTAYAGTTDTRLNGLGGAPGLVFSSSRDAMAVSALVSALQQFDANGSLLAKTLPSAEACAADLTKKPPFTDVLASDFLAFANK